MPLRRLGLEVAPDHLLQLVQVVDDREVEVGQEVGREDHPPVAVDDERLHGSLPLSVVRCRRRGAGRLRQVAVPASQARTAAPSLVERGRRGVRGPGDLLARRVEEPQRRSGQLRACRGWRARRRSSSPGCGSAPRRTPRRWCAPCPAGTPISSSRASRSAAFQPANTPSTSSMSRSRLADALPVGRQAGRGRVEVEAGAEPPPEPFAAHRDLDEAVGAVEQAVGRDRGVVVALGAADLAGDGPAGRLEAVHPDRRRPAARCAPRCPTPVRPRSTSAASTP